ncbi:hypothetical protein [Herbaspirillum sp. alder98]|uniref:hypothetical protein n=1 Tax=Herbaspirillum sp. alder98 TaxID=2913096 RepID=UPI001CD81C39|nr:hypothetical protein [Herbaspirillum sp. alder98]MCA1326217.1 hypothetical protein [Herbaspirillum sp. alder98]
MREWWASWYNKYAVVALATAVGVAAYNEICWSNLSASDWATWVGSIGTVAALIGAIYIATSERRLIQRDARSLGAITLMSMQFRLNTLRLQVEKVAIAMHDWTPERLSNIDYSASSENIKAYCTLEMIEIERIRSVNEGVAMGMAAAVDHISYCCHFMGSAAKNPKIQGPLAHKRFCREMSQLLAAAAMNLRAAMVLAAQVAGRPGAEFQDKRVADIVKEGLPPWRPAQ